MTRTSQMLKHSTIYAVGNISRQLVGFVMLPIYTTYLSPADYGVIGLLVFLVSLFELLLGGHMFSAVPKFYHQEESISAKNSVLVTALLITTGFSGLAAAMMALFSENLSLATFGSADYKLYVQIFSALIVTHAWEQYGLIYLRILKRPWSFLAFSFCKLFIQLSLNILTIVILNLGLIGLALSSLVSSLLVSTSIISYTIYKTGFKPTLRTVASLLHYSWPLWISGVIGLYIGSSNRYYIRVFSSLDDVGLFELAAKFGAIIALLVWNPFSQYWQTERFEIAKAENPYPIYNTAFQILSALMLIAGLGVCISADIVIKLMSSSPFHTASQAVPLLVLSALFQSLTIFHNFSFLVDNNTLKVTYNNLFAATLITVLNIAFIPYYGFVGAALATATASVLQYLFVVWGSNKIYPLKINQTGFILAALTAAAATGLASGLNTLTFTDVALRAVIFIFGAISILLLIFGRKISLVQDYVTSFTRKNR